MMLMIPVLYGCTAAVVFTFMVCVYFVACGNWIMLPFAVFSICVFYRCMQTIFLHHHLVRMAREAHEHYERTRLAYVDAITGRSRQAINERFGKHHRDN